MGTSPVIRLAESWCSMLWNGHSWNQTRGIWSESKSIIHYNIKPRVSECEWITYSRLVRVDQVAPPVFEPVNNRFRRRRANHSATAPHMDRPRRLMNTRSMIVHNIVCSYCRLLEVNTWYMVSFISATVRYRARMVISALGAYTRWYTMLYLEVNTTAPRADTTTRASIWWMILKQCFNLFITRFSFKNKS